MRSQPAAALTLSALGLTLLAACAQRPTATGTEPAPAAPAAVAEGESARQQAAGAAPAPAVSAPAAQAAQKDWPQFRGPGGLGISPDRGLPLTWSAAQGIRWKAPLPGAGTSSPIVLGNRIFLTCYSGYGVPGQEGGSPEQIQRHVVCLDRASGKLLWDTKVKSTAREEPVIREGHGYASNTPAADSERVYAFFGPSGVYALDHSGRQLWHAEVGDQAHGWGSGASLVLHKDLLIVNASVESQSLIALNKRTGKEVWRAGDIREAWNTPLLVSLPGGKQELAIAVLGKVLGFDPDTGERLWECDTDISWYMVPSLVAKDGVIYCIGGRSGGALAVRAGGHGDVTRTHRVWSGRKGSNVSSPLIYGDHLYWARESPAVAFCAVAKTGEVVYEERLRTEQVYASPILADGRLYYLGRDGRAFVLPAAPRFEVLAVNELGESGTFNATPAVAGGRIYLRSDRYLYCL